MGSASNYVEDASLDFWLNGSTAIIGPANVWLALFNTGPDEDGTGGIEVSGNSYSRTQCTPPGADSSRFTIIDGLAVNSANILTAVPTGPWGLITSAALYDAATDGNLLFLVTLVNGSFTPIIGQPILLPLGELQVRAS